MRQAGGSTVCGFDVAVNTRTKDEQGEFIANFYNCGAWGKLGENCGKFLHKGERVALTGDLTLRPYVDKKGQNRVSPQIYVTDVEFFFEKKDKAQGEAAPAQNNQAKGESEDDLPF